MEKIFVVLISVDNDGDSRKVCERIQNNTYNTRKELADELIGEGISDYSVYSTSDFMDGVNDQELDVLANDFISFVKILG